MQPLSLLHLYYLISWKEVSPYVRFIDISATRQKIAMELQRRGMLNIEPFLTVTPAGNELLEYLKIQLNLKA